MNQNEPAAGIPSGVPFGTLAVMAMAARATTGNLIVFDGVRMYCPSCRTPAPMLAPVLKTRIPGLTSQVDALARQELESEWPS